MRHLTLIRIKNSEFDYEKYGLQSNYFTIDVSTSFAYTKNVGVTKYALLDGTTRADNISREPASLTLQGELGEVRGGNNSSNFVTDTAERNRLQNQMDLLEALRDQAIFLDFITDERTYRNFLITGLNFGKVRLAQVTVSMTIQEVITFGDEITVEQTNKVHELSNYEQQLILDNFEMRPINSDLQLVEEIYRVIVASNLTTPFIISLGSLEIAADVVMPTYSLRKKASSAKLYTVGSSVVVSDTNSLLASNDAVELMTGTVAGENYLHITIPQVIKGQNLYDTRLTLNSALQLEQVNISKTFINIRLKNGNNNIYSVQKGEILKTPQYSDIVNGIHYLNTTGLSDNTVSTAKYGLCFIRKQKNNSYTKLPNLLGNDSRGYLYNSTYEKIEGANSRLYPGLVYIHPQAWIKIKEELNRVWSESTYFKNKRLVL